jgi:hypothetical protein
MDDRISLYHHALAMSLLSVWVTGIAACIVACSIVWRWRHAVFAVIPISIIFAVLRVALFSDPVLREWIRAERGRGPFTACWVTAVIIIAGPIVTYAARWSGAGRFDEAAAPHRQAGSDQVN